MKKSFLLSLTFIIGITFAYSQTIVSTNPENRNALIEEFTGIACGFCPYGHLEVANFIDQHPGNAFSIAYHQGYFAQPSPGQPDYTTLGGDALGTYFQVSGWPTGMVNRVDFGSGLLSDLSFWSGYGNTILAEQAYVNIACEATINLQTRDLSVHVETYFTGNSPADENYIHVAITQKNVKGPQFSSWFNPEAITPDGAYMHQHMFRDMVTDVWGDQVSPTTQGTFIDKTYEYTIPETIKDIPLWLGNLEIVCFISEDETNTENASACTPQLSNYAWTTDAGLEQIFAPEQSSAFIQGKVEVSNNGSSTINSITFNIQIGAENPVEYVWSGQDIGPYTVKEICLPAVFFNSTGTNDYQVQIISVNGNTDEDTTNNVLAKSFTEAPEVALPVTLNLTTDNYFGTAWYLYDDQNNVIQQGSGYSYNQTFEIPLIADAGSYKLEMTDLDGFFNGNYSLTDGDNNTFFSVNGNFGNSEITSFNLPIYEPTAIINSNTQVACIGGAIEFMDASTGGPTSWEWTFEGGDPEASTEKNPMVSYQEPGIYDVTLMVTNDLGTSQVTVENYIMITSLDFGNLALEFDGNDDYVELSNESAFDFTDAVTLELWIKPGSLSGTQGLISKNFGNNAHPYQIRLNNGEVLFGFYSNTIGWQPVETYNANLQVDEWVHIACTYNMQFAKIFINGVQKASSVKTFEIPQNNQPVEIGRSKDVAFEYFDGIIDEVRIWDMALDEETIYDNMCGNYAGTTNEHLVGYYKFNECGGTQLSDVSNFNNGILMNMVGNEWLESDACPVYTVTFNVVDGNNSFPVEGATVNMNGTIRYTNDNGVCEYIGYEAGTYDYVVSFDGAISESGSFDLTDENIVIDISLLITGINPDGTLAFEAYPNPVENVLIVSTPEKGTISLTDIFGGIVYQNEDVNGNHQIDLKNAIPGMYILKYQINDKMIMRKILVK